MIALWHVFCLLCTVVPVFRQYLPLDIVGRYEDWADMRLDADIEGAKRQVERTFRVPTTVDVVPFPTGDRERELLLDLHIQYDSQELAELLPRVSTEQQYQQVKVLLERLEKAQREVDEAVLARRSLASGGLS